MNSPVEVIEKIAKSEDRSLAIIFFLFFSRFEYALKRAGYVATGEEAKPDWTRYALKHARLLISCNNPRFINAVDLIRNFSPKKQKNSDGRLTWESDHFSQPFDCARLVTLTCRIRNNLFHGGKFPEGPENDISRDRDLVSAGLTVLQTFLEFDGFLRNIFLEELA